MYYPSSDASLFLPLNVTTPCDSFCLFAWGYREMEISFRTLYVTGLKVDSNSIFFEQGLIDLAIRPFLLHLFISLKKILNDLEILLQFVGT